MSSGNSHMVLNMKAQNASAKVIQNAFWKLVYLKGKKKKSKLKRELIHKTCVNKLNRLCQLKLVSMG